MEYPTLVTLTPESILGLGEATTEAGLELTIEVVTIHEIGHQWWQSMVAFNEAEEPWLDEGLADYSTSRVMERSYASRPLVDIGGVTMSYLDSRRLEYLAIPNVPMEGKAWDFSQLSYGVATYSKPVLAWTTLERTLGDETLLKILSTFFQRYQYAHPRTEDLRRVAQEVSSQSLDWFFDGLVYGNGTVDYRVGNITQDGVTVVRDGDLAVPVDVQVDFAGGQIALEDWDGLEASKSFTYPERPAVTEVQIDPQRKVVVDLVWSDNGMSRSPDLWSWAALFTRAIFQLQNWILALGGF
jgi:hypothetical protein